MMTSRKPARPKYDEVDRAFIRVQRAVHDLVRLMIHPDRSLAIKAALAVGEVPEVPVRPLAATAALVGSLPQREAMLVLIREISPSFSLEVLQALMRVLESDPPDRIKELVEEIVGAMRERSLKVFKKENPQESVRPQDRREGQDAVTAPATGPDGTRSRKTSPGDGRLMTALAP
jgi:hypothetical protein